MKVIFATGTVKVMSGVWIVSSYSQIRWEPRCGTTIELNESLDCLKGSPGELNKSLKCGATTD